MDYLQMKELYHHGIKGQKWGDKNGPPYPLDYDDHSAAERKENPKGKLNNYDYNSLDKKEKRKSLRDFAKDWRKERRLRSAEYENTLDDIQERKKAKEISRKQARLERNKAYDEYAPKKTGQFIYMSKKDTDSLVKKYGKKNYDVMSQDLDRKQKRRAAALITAAAALLVARTAINVKLGYGS